MKEKIDKEHAMNIRALVPLADGVEEMEAVIIIDVLRRAGWNVVTAGIRNGTVIASRKVALVPDTILSDIYTNDLDIIILPGGAQGTKELRADKRIIHTVLQMFKAGKTVAAICAAPLVLQDAGILKGRRATCHPGVKEHFTATEWINERVVIDGNIITSQGPGTAFEFALALVEKTNGRELAAKLSSEMILPIP